jgi:alkylation response protein AidB-like acyl-CoA dehydrogenase
MDLSLSDDQAAILGALEALAKPFAATPANFHGFALVSEALDRALAEGGFLDVAYESDLGPLTAALVVAQLARLPYAAEVAASALVRPLLGADLRRPICLADADAPHVPVRFLAPGASVIVLHRDRVTGFTASAQDVRETETLFGYPVAMLVPRADRATVSRRFDVSPAVVRAAWRVGLAAEIAGLLGAAIDATVLYVSDRKQFGRPIGTFQAVRHRLAEASVRATATRWLALLAADSGDPGDAALAAQYAQDAATSIVYDLHQFLGAMGMTLEHPLHLWTYRLKALLADVGGRSAHAVDAAALIWDNADAVGADPLCAGGNHGL